MQKFCRQPSVSFDRIGSGDARQRPSALQILLPEIHNIGSTRETAECQD